VEVHALIGSVGDDISKLIATLDNAAAAFCCFAFCGIPYMKDVDKVGLAISTLPENKQVQVLSGLNEKLTQLGAKVMDYSLGDVKEMFATNFLCENSLALMRWMTEDRASDHEFLIEVLSSLKNNRCIFPSLPHEALESWGRLLFSLPDVLALNLETLTVPQALTARAQILGDLVVTEPMAALFDDAEFIKSLRLFLQQVTFADSLTMRTISDRIRDHLRLSTKDC
jgi:hypothetical protein